MPDFHCSFKKYLEESEQQEQERHKREKLNEIFIQIDRLRRTISRQELVAYCTENMGAEVFYKSRSIIIEYARATRVLKD